ncbi:MAG: SurA N-terminal domain-containing protein, partial [Puniceicoccales bacterium]|nr:SurA N-terminal domain-containing protein [Puniceicoccales bacterium]
MISFLQNLLQKHHKWLFSMLLFVIVVAFVFTIGASPGIGRPLTKRRYFYGQDLSNAAEMTTIAENAIYAGLLESKDAGFARSNLDFFVAKRIIALWLANEFGIPNPSSENLGKYMRAMAIFIDESGKFSADLYASVLEILRRNGNGEDRLKQILCENYKIREVEAMLAGNGIAFNWQVMSHLARTETEYDLIVATLRKEDCKINENVN